MLDTHEKIITEIVLRAGNSSWSCPDCDHYMFSYICDNCKYNALEDNGEIFSELWKNVQPSTKPIIVFDVPKKDINMTYNIDSFECIITIKGISKNFYLDDKSAAFLSLGVFN